MANFLSYELTQPYWLYIENWSYNVVPGIVTLTFDTAPSTDPNDYTMRATQGVIMAPQDFGFSSLDGTFVLNGNTVALTVPDTMDSDVYMQFFYQLSPLPFRVKCEQSYRFTVPAIFTGEIV